MLVLDKTGTITNGQPTVTDVISTSDQTETQLLSILASLEHHSEHPLARAIVNAADQQKLKLAPVTHFLAIEGKGVRGQIGQQTYLAGNSQLAQDQQLSVDQAIINTITQQGKTPVIVMSPTTILGYIGLADTPKPVAKETIHQLHKTGLKIALLTGDNHQTANHIAQQVGIDQVIAEVLPADKAKHISNFKQQGEIVAMVGDGINDAPALASADIGIAMGTGTDVAIESAGITLLGGNLAKLPQSFALANATMRTIKQNLFWAFFYNVISIPIAAGILYPVWGVMLNPAIAGAAMAFSSVSVVLNALRLKRVKV